MQTVKDRSIIIIIEVNKVGAEIELLTLWKRVYSNNIIMHCKAMTCYNYTKSCFLSPDLSSIHSGGRIFY